MKKKFSINHVSILFLFIALSAFPQSILFAQNRTIKAPIGAVEITVPTNDSEHNISVTGQIHLTMFADTSSTKYENSKSLTLDISDGLFVSETDQSWFNSEFGHHYGTDLICMDATKDYYKILTNKSGVCYWLKRSEFLRFIKIDDYLNEIFLVKGQSIYTSPNTASPKVSISIANSMNCDVVQIKGDWVQIKQSESEEGIAQNTKFKTGWVKWFSANGVIVGLVDSY